MNEFSLLIFHRCFTRVFVLGLVEMCLIYYNFCINFKSIFRVHDTVNGSWIIFLCATTRVHLPSFIKSNDKTTTVFQSIQKWQKIIWRSRKIVSQANKTSQASPCDVVYTEETQWKCFRGTCLAFYNTAPTLWNSPSGRSEIHYDLKWPELN